MFVLKNAEAGRETPPGNLFYRWLSFIVGIFLIAGLIFISPALERVPGIGPMIEALRESGVEVGAFWWADMPEVSEAERFIRQPGGFNSEN
jgi:hypothetical protein